MNYQIIPMDRTHISQIAQLERECFPLPWTEAMLEGELYNDTASFLVALGEDGLVWGYAGIHVVLDEGYLANVAVSPDHRRQGVARELLEVYHRFGQAHLAFISLEVRPSNRAAIDLYMNCGYGQVGRRKDFYTQPTEDGIIMTRVFNEEGTV